MSFSVNAFIGRVAVLSRLAESLSRRTFGGKRDLYEILGWKSDPKFADFLHKYDRQDIAERIVSAYPDAAWAEGVRVKEDDSPTDTEFERVWKALDNRLRVVAALKTIDELSGIGRFGVLLLGLNDGLPLDQPAVRREGSGPAGLIYLRPFHEGCVTVHKTIQDPRSDRFGQPEIYRIDFSDEGGSTSKKVDVHWTRALHVAEGRSTDPIYGKPRLRAVFNRLDDIEKIVGGSAEMFWLGAKGVTQVDIDPERAQLEPDPDKELERLQEELDEVEHGVRRWLRTRGVTLKQLEAQSPDPSEPFAVQIKLISGNTGIPQRVLLGSEQAEMASTQDRSTWHERVRGYQNDHAAPNILRPFIERCQSLGILPEASVTIEWPDLAKLTPTAAANVFVQRMNGLKAYTDTPELVVGADEVRAMIDLLPRDVVGEVTAEEDMLDIDDDRE